jgi:hypothetical protein
LGGFDELERYRQAGRARLTSVISFVLGWLHPWIVRRIGVHGRATAIDDFGAQFVVPGFVAVDLA